MVEAEKQNSLSKDMTANKSKACRADSDRKNETKLIHHQMTQQLHMERKMPSQNNEKIRLNMSSNYC